ncbi:L,D-transpeptidase family protein [Trichloromonas sp.]|uniref:L,D-transpeptidase family protein n=1 Tax=Trichloromonas sp. TaxID=3069249 RepID=UPI003D8176B0
MRRVAAVFLLLLLVCLEWSVSPPVYSASLATQIEAELRVLLEPVPQPGQLPLGQAQVRLHPSLRDFYSARGYTPAWVSDQGEVPLAETLLDALREASAEGLCPEDYHLDLLASLLRLADDSPRHGLLFDPHWMARLELLLTDAFLWYASDHLQGRMAFIGLRQQSRREKDGDPAQLLDHALKRQRLQAALSDLVPAHPGYRRLMQQLEQYRQLAVMGGWPKVPSGAVVRPKERDSRVRLLKARLLMTEPVAVFSGEDPDLLDVPAVRALRAFQKRHGLGADGVLGPRTLAELNVSVEERIRQIELNLERWRWLPKNLEKRYLQVNIADFSLKVVENDQVVMSMPVVVGNEYRKTPVFSGEMTYLEFAPFWYVPPTILREDKLPIIKRNPGWLKKNHYEIVSWRGTQEVVDPARIDWKKVNVGNFPGALRMKPGPWNPLGQVKFMFPNRFSIYLHDTSERHLFQRRVRLFSSGCIRIERPLDLAQYLLEPQGVSCAELLDAVQRDAPLRMTLKRSMPVQLLYWTAWVEPDGMVNFRRDFYLRDLDMETALEDWRYGGGINSEQILEPAESDQGADR